MSHTKRRKVGKGKKEKVEIFREKLISLIENWELEELVDRNDMSNSTDMVSIVIKRNKSEKFREVLMKKKKDLRNTLGSLYEKYIDNECPKQYKDIVYNLVHYFFYGRTPLSKHFKSNSTLRKEEEEVMKEFDIDDIVEVPFGDDSITRDVFWEILLFVPHDYDHLMRIGLVNELFFVSFLMTWDILRIVPPRIKGISLVVLKSAREVVFVDDRKYEDDDEDIPKGDQNFNNRNLKYLFSHLTLGRINTFNLSRCHNHTSLLNIFKFIFSQNLVFSNVSTLKFPNIPFERTQRSGDDEWMEDDNAVYSAKKDLYNFASRYYPVQQNYFPSIRTIKNATIEGMLLFPPKVISERITDLELYLFKRDSNVLNQCGLDCSRCVNFSLFPREILKSSYVERVFEKITFSDFYLRNLTIFVSSDDDEIVLGHESMGKLEYLVLDFSGNEIDPVVTRNYWYFNPYNYHYHSVESPNLSFLNDIKIDHIYFKNYPLNTLKRPILFNKMEECKNLEIILKHYEEKKKKTTTWYGGYQYDGYSDGKDEYPFVNSKEAYHKFFLSCFSNNLSFKYKNTKIEFQLQSQIIKVEIREEYLSLDLLYNLSSLSNSLVKKTSRIKNYKEIHFYLYSQDHESKVSLKRFLKEYFSFCDIISTNNNQPIKKKKKKKKKKIEKKPLDGCVICISQIGNPERSKIRRMAVSLGSDYAPQFSKSVTHMIVPSDGYKAPKVKSALNEGIYVVDKTWVYNCSKKVKKCSISNFRMFCDDSDDDESSSSSSEEEEKEDVIINSSSRFEILMRIVKNRGSKKKKKSINIFTT